MFTGALRDGATELDHMGARAYYATLGRFTSPDPENAGADPSSPGSWNMYSYAYNNPLMYTDPSGMCGEVDAEGNSTENPWCAIYELARNSALNQIFHKTEQRVREFISRPRDNNC